MPARDDLRGSYGADPLSRVVLAISTFRTDGEVVGLLEKVFQDGGNPFHAVVVVDSLSSGAIEAAIRRNRWPVRFWSADHNLGAAGNHAKRMEIAASYDADWCYAVNADGEVDLEAVRALVRCGSGAERVGAVYPLRKLVTRGGSFEAPHRTFLPMSSARLDMTPSSSGAEEVAWASSNGALYGLGPPRAGLYVWTDLWLGWEDLSYSWILWRNGWRQLLCPDAFFHDPYEHRRVSFLGRPLYIHDKAPWIAYYTVRNLALFVRRSEAGLKGWLVVLWRWLQESLLVLLFRSRKLLRLRLLVRGLVDGIRGRGGMVTSPDSC